VRNIVAAPEKGLVSGLDRAGDEMAAPLSDHGFAGRSVIEDDAE
jgi:hypothetical protein